MIQLKENAQTDLRTDRPYFIGPFRLLPGVEKLIKDEKSVVYTVDRISRLLLGKAKKSSYKKDKVFYKCYLDLEDKNVLYEREDPKKSILFYTPFLEQRKDIGSLPYIVSRHPANLCMVISRIFIFFPKFADNQKYCLLGVDLFTSKTYTYPMKSRHLLAQKMELFYCDIQPKRQ